jgi:hypothetical protein
MTDHTKLVVAAAAALTAVAQISASRVCEGCVNDLAIVLDRTHRADCV